MVSLDLFHFKRRGRGGGRFDGCIDIGFLEDIFEMNDGVDIGRGGRLIHDLHVCRNFFIKKDPG